MKNFFSLLSVLIFLSSALTPAQKYFIDKWGLTPQGKAWPILNDSATINGYAKIAGSNPTPGWATIRGGFNETLYITKDTAVVVRGKIELIGEGGGDTYSPFRYALTYHENDSLRYQYTDSAYWVRELGSGYGFHPRSGIADMSNGIGGVGTVWTIVNGNWNSTISNGGLGPLAAVNQAPQNAELIAGFYEFAISIHKFNDTINELRWYLIEGTEHYWFGGIITAPNTTDRFNAINFGLNSGGFTGFNIIDAAVNLGEPLPRDPICFCPSGYIEQWGFFGGKFGEWGISNNDVIGNITISGNAPNSGWTTIRGEFGTFTPAPDLPFKITGNIEFIGDGFDEPGSFRIGLFNTESAGNLLVDTASASLPDSTHWTGTDDNASGYLFIPQSGSNGIIDWDGTEGTWGAVIDTTWFVPAGYTLGSELPNPSIGGAGEYEFEISVTPQVDGSSLIKLNLLKDNYSWVVSAADDNPVTDKFNSIAFALNSGNNITALNITDVKIDTGTIVNVENIKEDIPINFALYQNYPNPFNPSTTIKYSIAQTSNLLSGGAKGGLVTLKVYDILGNEIATLVNEEKTAGNYIIKFDGSNLSSGVYFYQLKSGNFLQTKKLILLK